MFHPTRLPLVLAAFALLASAAWSPAAADRDLDDGWVGCSTTDSACPFDIDTYVAGPSMSLLPEGNYPYDATITPDGTEVWFVGASGNGAVVIDRATNAITHRIVTGQYPTSIAFSDDGALALVSCRDTENVTLIDTGSYAVVGSLQLPAGYDGGNIALDPISRLFYLIDWYDNTLFEIAEDGSAVLRQVDIGNNLWQLVVSPDGQTVYVTDRGADLVRIIERATLTQVGTVPVGDDPWGIDITADGGKLVVVCEDSHTAHIVDTSTLIVTPLLLDPTADPRDVDILDAGQRAFLCGGTVGSTSDPIYVIDLTDNTIETVFEANGSNTNVIAVQAQMHSGGSGDVAGDPTLRVGFQVRAFPNPLMGRTELTYTLAEAGTVDLVIFDPAGRVIRRLADGKRAPGMHQALWDGLDEAGQAVPAGIYLLRASTAQGSGAIRLVMVR